MPDDVHRQGKTIAEIKEGDSLTVTESISERDLLIYLGLTNDNNPLYIQNEYAQKLGHAGPVVPPVLLSGIITSSVSKLLPGPGSEVVNFSANFIRPVDHDEIVTFSFEVIKVETIKEVVMISVEGSNRQNERVLDPVVMARPPRQED